MDFNFPDSTVNLLRTIMEKESLLASLVLHAGRQNSSQGMSAEEERDRTQGRRIHMDDLKGSWVSTIGSSLGLWFHQTMGIISQYSFVLA